MASSANHSFTLTIPCVVDATLRWVSLLGRTSFALATPTPRAAIGAALPTRFDAALAADTGFTMMNKLNSRKRGARWQTSEATHGDRNQTTHQALASGERVTANPKVPLTYKHPCYQMQSTYLVVNRAKNASTQHFGVACG